MNLAIKYFLDNKWKVYFTLHVKNFKKISVNAVQARAATVELMSRRAQSTRVGAG